MRSSRKQKSTNAIARASDEVRRVPCLFALGIGFPRKDSNEDIFAYYVINRAFLDAIDDGVCDDD